MIKYEIQVFVDHVKDDPHWEAIRASKSIEPYRYDTREEAVHMLEMCYPDQCRDSFFLGDGAYTGTVVYARNGRTPRVRILEVKDEEAKHESV